MNTKNYVIIGVIVVVVAAGAFFGGYKFGQGQSSSKTNLPGQGQFGQAGQRNRVNGAAGARLGNGGGFVNGIVIAKDDKSITVKSSDGGSKLIFISNTTSVGKFVAGAQTDLEVGKNVMINGSANTDGSITAQSIQIRPIDSAGPNATSTKPIK